MTEALLLITAVLFFALGWFAHFFAARSANQMSQEAFKSLLSAWNARFAPRSQTVNHPASELAVATIGEQTLNNPKPKAPEPWNITALRESEIAKTERNRRLAAEAGRDAP